MAPTEDSLIRSWTIEFSLSPHSGDSLELEATAHIDADLSEALPYLNAELGGSRFTPTIPALIWMYADHQVGILVDRIVIDHVHEEDDVSSFIKEIVGKINEIWARRDAIQPRHTPRSFRQPLEIFSLLPQTNCKLCGEATCYSFALKLTVGGSELAECLPLFESGSRQDAREALVSLLNSKDPTQ
jgi:ArsR family metal-binding transcriptional regulator